MLAIRLSMRLSPAGLKGKANRQNKDVYARLLAHSEDSETHFQQKLPHAFAVVI